MSCFVHKIINKSKLKYILWLSLLLLVLALIYTFDIYYIPSKSMEDTLLIGDIVLIKKIHRRKAVLKTEKTSFKNYCNKVLVFNDPEEDSGKYFIKRCLAGPGDTLLYKNYEFYLNRTLQSLSFDAKYLIKARTDKKDQLNAFADSCRVSITGFGSGTYNLCVTQQLIDTMVSKGLILSYFIINRYNSKRNSKLNSIPGLIIPKKGEHNSYFSEKEYGLLFNQYETADSIIKNNYYFMVGDNRGVSVDSRSWGVLPESNIIGKAILVLYSTDKSLRGLKKIRFNRILKVIH